MEFIGVSKMEFEFEFLFQPGLKFTFELEFELEFDFELKSEFAFEVALELEFELASSSTHLPALLPSGKGTIPRHAKNNSLRTILAQHLERSISVPPFPSHSIKTNT